MQRSRLAGCSLARRETTLRVESVEPLSTTTSSRLTREVSRRRERNVSSRTAARLRVLITTAASNMGVEFTHAPSTISTIGRCGSPWFAAARERGKIDQPDGVGAYADLR